MGLPLLWKSCFTAALILISSVIKDVFLEQVLYVYFFFQRHLRRYINPACFRYRFTRNVHCNLVSIIDYKMQHWIQRPDLACGKQWLKVNSRQLKLKLKAHERDLMKFCVCCGHTVSAFTECSLPKRRCMNSVGASMIA